ncbi:recQ-mediated genome instability protein 1-like protein [Leptotrombidium deliense]|uniref:RecQ-mediated genome instability protein 1 n=1 Tax=Leptotrombidium deliense TaxID=299467 RepID=A0A443SN18_9ACAR|nr:recQ-mediated genome instability protein 1-like protein [Leptotrombidium deliense]
MDEGHLLPIDLFDQTSTTKREWKGARVVQLISVCLSNAPFIDTTDDFLELPDENSDDEYSSNDRKDNKNRLTKNKVKGPRLLSLLLTDGKHEFKAIEYKPIDSLSDQLPIGIKLLLKGTVEIQMGIMFLRPENIEILGGSVSSGRANGANATNGNVDCEFVVLQ